MIVHDVVGSEPFQDPTDRLWAVCSGDVLALCASQMATRRIIVDTNVFMPDYLVDEWGNMWMRAAVVPLGNFAQVRVNFEWQIDFVMTVDLFGLCSVVAEEVMRFAGASVDNQRIIFHGREIPMGESLAAHGVSPNSTLFSVLRIHPPSVADEESSASAVSLVTDNESTVASASTDITASLNSLVDSVESLFQYRI